MKVMYFIQAMDSWSVLSVLSGHGAGKAKPCWL